MAINIYNHTNLFPILGTGKPILLIQAGDHRIWPPYGGGAISMNTGSATNFWLGAYYTTNDASHNGVASENNLWMIISDSSNCPNMYAYYHRYYNTVVGRVYYKAYVKYTSSSSVTFNVIMYNRDHNDRQYVSQSAGIAGTNVKKIWTGYVTNSSWGNTSPGTPDYIMPPAPTTSGVYIAESAVVLSYTDMS